MQKEVEQSSWCLQVSVHVSKEITERMVYVSREYSLLRKVKQALTTSCILVSRVLSHILHLVLFFPRECLIMCASISCSFTKCQQHFNTDRSETDVFYEVKWIYL